MDFIEAIDKNEFGYLYGFNLFETFLVQEDHSVFLIERHIDRLFGSAVFFKLDIKIDKKEFQQGLQEFIYRNVPPNKIVRVTLNYGNPAKDLNPTAVVTWRENPYQEERVLQGCKLCLSRHIKSSTSLILRHKTGNYLENYLALKEAKEEGFDDALFLNERGEVTETTKANLFMVKEGALYTPPPTCGLLPGIVRGWVMEQAKDMGIQCIETPLSFHQLLESDEVFATNSVMGILPVKYIDNQAVGKRLKSNITRKFAEVYKDSCTKK